MQISPQEEYAVRCMIQLARLEPGRTLSASKIAEREGISIEYVSKILFCIRRAGLVRATRGAQGGFHLVKSPSKISLKNVIDAIQIGSQKKSGEFCEHYAGQQNQCVHIHDCCVRPVWSVLGSYFTDLLDHIRLDDLMDREQEVRRKVLQLKQESSLRMSEIFKKERDEKKATV